MKISPTLRRSALAGSAFIALALSGCTAMQEGAGTPSKETLQVVTDKLELLTLNAGQPTKVLKRVQLSGLATGDTLVGIDYRIAKGVLFALAKSGRLYTVDTATGVLKPVGAAPALAGADLGLTGRGRSCRPTNRSGAARHPGGRRMPLPGSAAPCPSWRAARRRSS